MPRRRNRPPSPPAAFTSPVRGLVPRIPPFRRGDGERRGRRDAAASVAKRARRQRRTARASAPWECRRARRPRRAAARRPRCRVTRSDEHRGPGRRAADEPDEDAWIVDANRPRHARLVGERGVQPPRALGVHTRGARRQVLERIRAEERVRPLRARGAGAPADRARRPRSPRPESARPAGTRARSATRRPGTRASCPAGARRAAPRARARRRRPRSGRRGRSGAGAGPRTPRRARCSHGPRWFVVLPAK